MGVGGWVWWQASYNLRTPRQIAVWHLYLKDEWRVKLHHRNAISKIQIVGFSKQIDARKKKLETEPIKRDLKDINQVQCLVLELEKIRKLEYLLDFL